MNNRKPVVFTIAGNDPSGNVGIQGDLKIFEKLNVSGVSVITANALRTEEGVFELNPTPADLLSQQIAIACKDKEISVVKIGMIATSANVGVVVWFLARNNFKSVVVDPIFHSSSGTELLESGAIPIFRSKLIPQVTLVTPNLDEASTLAGMRVFNVETMRTAAKEIFDNSYKISGGKSRLEGVLIKGGSLKGDAVDILYDGDGFEVFRSPRFVSKLTHGTGCILSAAIVSYLANGDKLKDAIKKSKDFLTQVLSQKSEE